MLLQWVLAPGAPNWPETTPARQQRYRTLLTGALPDHDRSEHSHRVRWLWRTVRAAELAGLDPAQVLTDAIGERDLAGSCDLAAVLDPRIRSRLGSLVPVPAALSSPHLVE